MPPKFTALRFVVLSGLLASLSACSSQPQAAVRTPDVAVRPPELNVQTPGPKLELAAQALTASAQAARTATSQTVKPAVATKPASTAPQTAKPGSDLPPISY